MTTTKKKEKEEDQPTKVYKPPVPPPPPSPKKEKKAKQSKEKKAKQPKDPKEKKEDQPSNATKEDQPTDTKEGQPKAAKEEQQIDATEDQPKKVKKVKQPKEKKAKQPQDTKEDQPTDTCTKDDQTTDTKEDQTTNTKEEQTTNTKEEQPKDETEDQQTDTKEEQPEHPKDEKENQPHEDEKDDQQPKDNELPIDDNLEKLKNNDMSFRSLNLVLNNDMDFVKLRKAMKGNTAVYQVQLQVDPYFMKWDEMQPLFKTMGSSLEGLKYLCLGNATTAAVCFSVIPIDALAALLKQAGTKLRWLYICGVRFTHHVAPDAPPSPTRSPTRSSPPEDAEGETGPGGDENKAIRKAFGKLGDAFQAASNLTKMSMMCQLDDVLVSAGCTLDPIVNAMGKMYSLETAVLCVEPSKPDKMDRIQVGDKALKHLFQCPSLKQLRILSLDFDASHIKAIATGLSDDEAALEEVFISANNTATEPCGASVGALFRAASCKLKQLTMEEYKFEDEGLVAMSIALATGGDHRMEELDISCRMQRMGSLAMSQMLMVNKSLKKLRLHDMEFDNDESPLELIKGLAGTKAAKNSTLDTLELAGRFRQDVDEEKIKELHSKKKFSSTVTKEMDTEKEADAEKEADTEKEADAEKEAEEPAGPTTCIRIERILEKDSKDKTDSV